VITFDANILFHAGDERARDKRQRSAELLRAAASQNNAFLTLQALGEFALAAVRKGLLNRVEAARVARDWSGAFEIRSADASAFETALEWWADERLSYWDALFVATASKAGATACVSEDLHDGATIGGVEVINPFSTSAAGRLAVHGLKV